MIVKLLTERHLEFLSFTGGCTGSSESAHVKMEISCRGSNVLAAYIDLFVVDALRLSQSCQDVFLSS